jgi:succinate dehydrogenase/fumarate reductase flavoprotein subunit
LKSSMQSQDHADVLVAGAGFGGLVTAATIAEAGRSVIVLEAAKRMGGTLALSSGLMHMFDAPTWDVFQKTFPSVDRELGKVLYEAFPAFVAWLEETAGVRMARIPLPNDPYGDKNRVPQGYLLGVPPLIVKVQPLLKRMSAFGYFALGDPFLQFLDSTMFRRIRLQVVEQLWSAAESRGARAVLGARLSKVTPRPEGGFDVVTSTEKGERSFRARAVVLATGGFQGSRSLLEQHLGPGGAHAMCRAASTNLGDGLRIGQELGGVLQGAMDQFYGLPMPIFPAPIDPETDPLALLTCSAFYASNSVLLTRAGERFVDEPKAAKSSELATAVATKAGGECWCILDAEIRRRFGRKAFGDGLMPGVKMLDAAIRRGAVVMEARTLEELAVQLSADGVDGARALQVIGEYNQAARGETAAKLSPPRTGKPLMVAEPPFYAIKLIPGVSMTYGGIRINGRAQVLNAGGQALAGVYAIPGLVGGLYTRQYGGALAACGTFGRVAGRAVTEDL